MPGNFRVIAVMHAQRNVSILIVMVFLCLPFPLAANEIPQLAFWFSGPTLTAAGQFPVKEFDGEGQAVVSAGYNWGNWGIINLLFSTEGSYLAPANTGQIRGTLEAGGLAIATGGLTCSSLVDGDAAIATVGYSLRLGLQVPVKALRGEKIAKWEKGSDLVFLVFRSDYPVSKFAFDPDDRESRELKNHQPYFQLGLQYSFDLLP